MDHFHNLKKHCFPYDHNKINGQGKLQKNLGLNALSRNE